MYNSYNGQTKPNKCNCVDFIKHLDLEGAFSFMLLANDQKKNNNYHTAE